ncbi:hypothetical protein P280DRAFT_466225 [Massarina eburnea CBS 473.64]|uniref:Rhodopsin domain-containing protein n=1 Tax=Massarina eburnea CBS 473.64 TaxID=1395130 RepID=A0A6A6SAW5_9PLEO|nr:hypothetical protein P280DRAFT_466225 [Massarina eburnea CBS 473.64]
MSMPTPPTPFPDDEPYNNFRARHLGALCSTFAVAMIVVPTKLWCRWKIGGWGSMGLDELLTFISLATGFAMNMFDFINVLPLLGKRLFYVVQSPDDLADLQQFLLYLYVANVVYAFCIGSMKLSIVAFYWKLFAVGRKSKMALFFMGGFIIVWALAMAFVGMFGCSPIRGAWRLGSIGTAKCLDTKKVYIGYAVPNVVTGVMLIAMPMPYVWRLHAPLAQRLFLAGMFALGTFVSVISIIRLTILVRSRGVSDITYDFRDIYLWSIVEVNVGLICVGLPCLRPMGRILGLNRLFSFSGAGRPSDLGLDPYRGLSKEKSRHKKPINPFSTLASGIRGMQDDEFEMMRQDTECNGEDWHGITTTAVAAHDMDKASDGSGTFRGNGTLSPGTINVQREVHVTITQSEER